MSVFFNSLQSTGYTHLPQFAFIVISGRVDEKAGADAVNLHCFKHRIGRCAWSVGYKGAILSCQCIDQGGLATVSPPEKSDMQSVGIRSFLKAHTD